jgi:Zn-dependent protease with chaperone function
MADSPAMAWRGADGALARTLCTALLVALVTGCASEQAGWRLQRLGSHTDGEWLPVAGADFPGGDPVKGSPTTLGSAALRDAVVADDGVAAFVREHGLPDAIAIDGPSALRLDLAYLEIRKVYTLEHSPAEAVSPRAMHPSEVSAVRDLRDDELAAIDPELLDAAERDALRAAVANAARITTIGRALLASAPAADEPGAYYGVLLMDATKTAAKLYGGTSSNWDLIVAWVDPTGPSRDSLRAGDRLLEINDLPPHQAPANWQGPQRLIVQRGRDTFRTEISPEALPRYVEIVLLPTDVPNAAAVDGAIGVTSGLLAMFPDHDDPIAVAMGHELAHVTLRHVEPTVTIGGVLKGVVSVGVLLPAEIALPGSGRMLGGLMQGVENRFNRDQERDADRLGLHYARAAGYDPQAALVLIDTLEAKAPVDGATQFFDIHAPYPERRALIVEELGRLP